MPESTVVVQADSTLPRPRIERRAAVRYSWTQQTSCHLITASRSESRWARVLDISVGGIGLLVGRHFEPGTILGVELHGVCNGVMRTFLVRVSRAAPQADGNWLIGCEFVCPLDEHELRSLL